jgi:type VI protein secretion system component Hcp
VAADNFLWFPTAASGGSISGAGQPAGESTDSVFSTLKALELKSFDFSLENPNTVSSGTTGAGAGKAKFGVFSVKKDVDKASTPLFQCCACGAHFPSVCLAIRKSGGDKLIYIQYMFRMVFVTKIGWSGGGGEENPEESIEFVYGAMGIWYLPQSPTGGADPGGPLIQNYSVVTNKPVIDVPGLSPAPNWQQNK